MQAQYIRNKNGHWGVRIDGPLEIVGVFLTEDVGMQLDVIDFYVEALTDAIHDTDQPFALSGNLCHIDAQKETTAISYIHEDKSQKTLMNTSDCLAALNHWKQLVIRIEQGESLSSGTEFVL